MVAVDDGHKVVQPILVGSHGRLVDAALALLSVAHQHVGVPLLTVHLGRQRHADTDAQPVAQRPAVHLDARHLDGRMAAKHGTILPQRVEHLGSEVALGLERHVERLDAVTLRQHEAVALFVALTAASTQGRRAARLQVLHHMKIQCRHHVQARQVAADMSCLGGIYHLNQPLAILLGKQLQCFYIHVLL